jgi:CheY-like chemotaxis protein
MPSRIVLIDFDETLLESNRKYLQSRGFDIRTALDGSAGLQLVMAQQPDFAVLDLVLPKIHGLQVCGSIRKDPNLRNTRVIVASSPTYPVDLKKAAELGAASFLNKPYQPEDLAKTIRSLETVPTIENDSKRVATLRKYGIMDTSPEQAFDDLTRLASIICKTPSAMITFIDSDRQWFKSRLGLGADEIPRQLSFCAHTIAQHDVLVVEDAEKDERFAGNPLVSSGPCIRFYAGSPLLASNGDALGSVCVIDQKPRTLDDEQKEALRLIANQVQALLEWKKSLQREQVAVAGD